MSSIVTPDEAQLNNFMLDRIIKAMHLKNDAALSRALNIQPPVTSKVRHGQLPIGASLVIAIHELTGWPIREVKQHLNKPSLALFKPMGAQ